MIKDPSAYNVLLVPDSRDTIETSLIIQIPIFLMPINVKHFHDIFFEHATSLKERMQHIFDFLWAAASYDKSYEGEESPLSQLAV